MDNFALIIGAMKCGTTSLFSYLSQHPMISACRRKEAFYFSDDDKFSRGFEWYQDLWDWDSNVHKIALEASVDYTRIPYFPNVAERISALEGQANFKFIYLMRNPLDRIESHYTHGRAAGWAVTNQPLSEEIGSELLAPSQYARQLEEYYKRFPHENILLLNFEELKLEPHGLLKRVCEFLDIDQDFEFQGLDQVHNANRQRIADERLWRSLRQIKQLRLLANRLSSQQKKAIYGLFGRKLKGNTKLTPEQRGFILQELKEDLRRLKVEYGFDVGSWGIEV
ncbi:MAG: sulfotransferase domain-containing protein [Leptolyngbyaceae cyanobacterium MO_188.B28]|nr:sulfotransferase domain-containing protein [Leptolyngbyaceae cyanobacterium MO_188.B28]